MLSDEIIDILNDKEIQALINKNSFYDVYEKTPYVKSYELTEVLWDCNIHPEFHMTEIPRYFLPPPTTTFDIPDNIKSIGRSAFYGCTSLTSINIPDRVTNIEDNAFSRCTSLKSINIPDSVMRIGYKAFNRCTSLKSITIPNSVTSIDRFAFSDLEELIYKGTKEQFRETGLTRKKIWRSSKPLIVKCDNGDIQLK